MEQAKVAGRALKRLYIEPVGRSTAPAVALVAHDLAAEDSQAVLLVLPADHDIPDEAQFADAVETAQAAAGQGHLMVFGVEPRWPETGYGYIERGEDVVRAPGCHQVASFVEKPELEIATRLAESGRHYWNSGMFLFRRRALPRGARSPGAGARPGVPRCRASLHGRCRMPPHRPRHIRALPLHVHRPRRDGAHAVRRRRPRALSLVGHRLVGRALGSLGEGRGRQRGARRRAAA